MRLSSILDVWLCPEMWTMSTSQDMGISRYVFALSSEGKHVLQSHP